MDLIIVNYKSTDRLHVCLKSVFHSLNGENANIHVFDNGSSDEIDRIKETFPQIHLHKRKYNLGFSNAVNIVLKETNSEYTVLLNPDTVVRDGLFKSARSHMESNPEIGILGPKILDPDGKTQGSARSFPTLFTSFFGRTSLVTRLFPNNRFTKQCILSNCSDGKTPMEVDWVSGACMFVRRKAIESVGFMDEQFFLYWEDADWCRRMRSFGWKVIYFPAASIIHSVGGSSEQNLIRSVYEFHMSAYRLYRKYYNSAHSILKLAVILGLGCRFILVVNLQLIRRLLVKIKRRIVSSNPNKSKLTNKVAQTDKVWCNASSNALDEVGDK